MARRMTLPGPARGAWRVTYESGRNAVVAQTTWTTVLSHPSGWAIVYDEADRAGVVLAPAEEPVQRLEVPPGASDPLGFLVSAAEDWVAVNGSSRGLPPLG